MANIGSAYLSIYPSMNGFAQQLTKELSNVQVAGLGKNIGSRLGSSVTSAFNSSGIETLQRRVSQAEADLTSAMYRSENAAKELLIAEKRLAETRAKHSADSSQVAQAELRVEQAQRKVASTSRSVETAQDRLSQAQRELETETNQATKSVQKQGRAFSSVTGSVAGFATKIGVISGLTQSVFSKLASVISTRLDSAISRVDTLNNFPKVMANLGYTTGEAEKAMDKLVDAIDGLPTTLDSITSMTQRLAPCATA